MPSKTEGRVSLALQAYLDDRLPSLRAAAKAYDVSLKPYVSNTLESFHERIRLQTRANSIPTKSKSFSERSFSSQTTASLPSALLLKKKWLIQCSVPRIRLVLKRSEWNGLPTLLNAILSCQASIIGSLISREQKYKIQSSLACGSSWFGAQLRSTALQRRASSTLTRVASKWELSRPPKQSQHRIGRADYRQASQLTKEWVTAIEAINAKGWAIPRFIMFNGKLHKIIWYQTGVPATWRIGVSENGWTNDKLGFECIEHFNESTEDSKGKWRLLIFDGYGSHQTAECRDYCLQNCNLILFMPAHTF